MNDVFQSLRFVFVMMIFMSHFAYRDVNPFDAGGDCGVAFFFLLSGFVMSMGYGRSITDGSFRFGHYIRPLIVVLLILALFSYPYTDEKIRNAPLYWMVLLPLIFVFANQKGPISRLLQHNSLRWLGSISMPIFLLHPIVFRSMFHFFPSISPIIMLFGCLVLVIAISWIVNRFLCNF